MRTLIRYSLILIFCFPGVVRTNAQMSLIKGLPFEATRTRIVTLPGDSYTVSGMVARSSNGSTYEEIRNHETGEIGLIHILDAPGRRSIFLNVKRRSYIIQPVNLAPLGDAPSKEALEKDIEFLKTLKPTRTVEDGYDTETTYLSFRTQDGFLEFGRRMVFDSVPASSKLQQKIWEDWEIIGLSLTVEKTGFDRDNKPVQITRFLNIKTKEPDPSLFEIPSGYAPQPTCPCK